MGGLPTSTINAFAVDPSNAKVMFVAVRDGIFRTEDGGWTWSAVRDGPKNVAGIAVNPKKPSEVYAVTMDGTIVRSREGGAQWNAAR